MGGRRGRRRRAPLPTCVSTSWLIYLDQAKAQMCLVKRQIKSQSRFQRKTRPLPSCGNLREAWPVRRPRCTYIHITCCPWSSCWAAGCTTAAAVCEPPPQTAAPVGTPRTIWRCAPAPSWRAASACPGTCPGRPAGTAPISGCGRTWRDREETEGESSVSVHHQQHRPTLLGEIHWSGLWSSVFRKYSDLSPSYSFFSSSEVRSGVICVLNSAVVLKGTQLCITKVPQVTLHFRTYSKPANEIQGTLCRPLQ